MSTIGKPLLWLGSTLIFIKAIIRLDDDFFCFSLPFTSQGAPGGQQVRRINPCAAGT